MTRGGAAGSSSFDSIEDALRWRREHHSAVPIVLKPGVHFLNRTLLLNASDSGLDLSGQPGAWISGGVPLDGLDWRRATDLGTGRPADNTWVTRLPVGRVPALYTLAPHRRLTRARYPDGDIETVQWGYASPDQFEVALPASNVSSWWEPEANDRLTTY